MKIEQFLEDPSFENWAKQVPGADHDHWQNWRENHSDHIGLMDEAKSVFLMDLKFTQKSISQEERNDEWEALSQRIGLPERNAKIRVMHRRRWMAAAAAAILLIATAWWAISDKYHPELSTETTGFGEIRAIGLPDGSTVTLNANSSLTFQKNWSVGNARLVELKGEAFFQIKHLPNDATFTVAAGEMDVAVLGTSFNVLARHNGPIISLVEGKVKLGQKNSQVQTVLAPGETAFFDKTKNHFEVETGQIERAISWKSHLWFFDKTPLRDVLQRMEDEFGLRCETPDQQLLEKNISGKVSTTKKEVLLKALEALLDMEVLEVNGVLKIEPLE